MQTARFHPHMAGHQIVLKSNLEETTQHGSEGFPAALYETVFRSKMLRYVPLHWHKELQLCLILTGRVRFSINQKEVEAGAGDVIFINSQVIHSATSISNDEEEASYCCINFAYEMVGGFHGSLMERNFVLPFLRNEQNDFLLISEKSEEGLLEEISSKMLHIRKLFKETEPERYFDIFAELVLIWKELVRWLHKTEDQPSTRRPEDYETSREVISYIEKNLGEKLTLDLIAKEVCLSKWECSRRFKRIAGESVWSYLISARMAKAVELLLYSRKSVERIGFEVGFPNVNLFIRQFKKEFRTTPGQFRKNH
ncbi:MAG: AraC family transcriptional regulator [Parasutterella excrementihominis]|jgi:putative transcriptional regulator, araC family|uniref:AraC family transcriptional regulator n=1 Tax=Parasutterella excrementihominis TaxID=487175 RepID=UPI0030772F98